MTRLDGQDVWLEPVTEESWRNCAALSVRPDQADYVATVTYYLCLCAYGTTWQPMAIRRGDRVVGFCMWGVDDDASRWIGGLVVDAAVQRTGVGRAALVALIERLEADPACTGVALSYPPANVVARRLYASLGFVETGETEDDGAEVVARRASPHGLSITCADSPASVAGLVRYPVSGGSRASLSCWPACLVSVMAWWTVLRMGRWSGSRCAGGMNQGTPSRTESVNLIGSCSRSVH